MKFFYKILNKLKKYGQEILYDYGHYNLSGSKYIGNIMFSDIYSILKKL